VLSRLSAVPLSVVTLWWQRATAVQSMATFRRSDWSIASNHSISPSYLPPSPSFKPPHLFDFPRSLSHQHCHLSVPLVSHLQMSQGAIRRLAQAARPYSVSTSDPDPAREEEDYGPDSGTPHGKDIWVSVDDVSDILLLAGVPVTTASVAQSVRALSNFLPGISQGKLCFQVH
jgi:hypothetical protein